MTTSLSRRTFLRGAGGAAAGVAVAGCDQPEPEQASFDPEGWIDAHVHVWSPDLEKWPLKKGMPVERMKPPSFTPEELFAECRPHGVARIVLIQMSFYGFDNSYMLDAMERYPGVFGGVAVVDADDGKVANTMKDLKKRGVRGFRIRATLENAEAWPQNEGMKTMWKTGAETGMAMCCLANADGLPGVRTMCEMYPETPVVIDHFGRIGVSGTVEQSDLDNLLRLADFETVKVKTSAFYALGTKAAPYTDLGPMIRQLKDAFGPERLMWATDCPYQVQKGHTYGDSVALIRDRLDFLTEEDKSWMLRKTAEATFFT